VSSPGPRVPREHPAPSLKYFLVASAVALLWLFTGFDVLHSTGYTGVTQKTGGSGCVCHGLGLPDAGVRVWVEGPASVTAGSANAYRLLMTGGPAMRGGFDLAVAHGTLSVTDTLTQIFFDEMTHTEPKFFFGDTLSWTFSYQAPSGPGADTMFSVGNSVDNDRTPIGDSFNFGDPFIVAVHADTTTAVDEAPPVVRTFSLNQNYPNPFNPSTSIGYSLGVGGEVELRVFDAAGRSVATLARGRFGPGSYRAEWDAATSPAGIYFCRLGVGGEYRVIKMLLIR